MNQKVSEGKKRKTSETVSGSFAAIDFETADYSRDSACAVSLVVAEENKVVHKAYSLVRPPRQDFIFSYIHGITWKDVAKKPCFGELWAEWRPLVKNIEFIAAHNASFDRSVLHACCARAGIKPLKTPFLCTMRLARKLWNIYPTKLPDVCQRLKINLKHHNALSDALACARIVLHAREEILPANVFLPGKMGTG